MSATASTTEHADPAARRPGLERQYQELWLTLARRAWTSVLIVPADPGTTAGPIAHALAEVGKRLSDVPVSAITVSSLEYGSALALADLRRHMATARPETGANAGPVIEVTRVRPGADATPSAGSSAAPSSGAAPFGGAATPANHGGGAELTAPAVTKLIVAIPSVVNEPLVLAVAQHAGPVVVAIEMARSRMANVRRTISMIGRERIVGCVLVH